LRLSGISLAREADKLDIYVGKSLSWEGKCWSLVGFSLHMDHVARGRIYKI